METQKLWASDGPPPRFPSWLLYARPYAVTVYEQALTLRLSYELHMRLARMLREDLGRVSALGRIIVVDSTRRAQAFW